MMSTLRQLTMVAAAALFLALAGCANVGLGVNIPIGGIGNIGVGVGGDGRVSGGVSVGRGGVSVGVGGTVDRPPPKPVEPAASQAKP